MPPTPSHAPRTGEAMSDSRKEQQQERRSGAKYLTLDGSVTVFHLILAVVVAIIPAVVMIARMPTEARVKELIEDRAPWGADKGRIEADLTSLRQNQSDIRASLEGHAREEGHPGLVVERVKSLKGQVAANRAASDAQAREMRTTMKSLAKEMRDALSQLQQLAAEVRAEQRAERQLKEALIKRVESIEDRLNRSQPGKGIAPPKGG